MRKLATLCSIIALITMLLSAPSHGAAAFMSQPISPEMLEAMERGNTWSKEALVPADRLRLLTITHWNFESQEQVGQMIVLDTCEDSVLSIFKALHHKKFPIHQIKPMHYYNGDDKAALNDNNSSCYIDRNIIGGTKKSLHAYGLAIDINPIQNPFVTMDSDCGVATYDPQTGLAYANRLDQRLGKPQRRGMAEEVIDIFAAHGFYWWGGYWDTPIDYQHFQIHSMLAALYLGANPQEAKSIFKTFVQYFNKHKKPLEIELLEELRKDGQEASLLDYYKKDQKRFEKCLKDLTSNKK